MAVNSVLYVTTYSPELGELGGAAFVDNAQLERLRMSGIAVDVFPVTGAQVPVSVRKRPRDLARATRRGIFSSEPFGYAKFRASRGWAQRVAALRQAFTPGQKLVTSQTPALMLAHDAGLRPDVHLAHNVDGLLAKQAPRLVRMLGETPRTTLHERRLLTDCSSVCTLSSIDAIRVADLVQGPSVAALDLEVPPPAFCRARSIRRIGFLGKLSWKPNAEALRVLVQEVMPRVRETLAGGPPKLLVAGRGRPSVLLPDWVEHVRQLPDVQAFYDSVDLVVVPRLGPTTGVSVKVLEAWSQGVAVVAPRQLLTAAGVDRNAVAADTPTEMTGAIVDLYERPELIPGLDEPESLTTPRIRLLDTLGATT